MKRTTGERWTGHFSPRPRQSAACLAVLSSSHRFILPCRYISTPLSTDPSPVRIATLHSIPASVSSERRQVVTASACRRVCTLVSDRRRGPETNMLVDVEVQMHLDVSTGLQGPPGISKRRRVGACPEALSPSPFIYLEVAWTTNLPHTRRRICQPITATYFPHLFRPFLAVVMAAAAAV